MFQVDGGTNGSSVNLLRRKEPRKIVIYVSKTYGRGTTHERQLEFLPQQTPERSS